VVRWLDEITEAAILTVAWFRRRYTNRPRPPLRVLWALARATVKARNLKRRGRR